VEPKIYESLRQFRRTLDQTVAVLDYLLDNDCLNVPHDEIKAAVELWAEINFAVGNRLASDEPNTGATMKSETYNALAGLNRGADMMLESLTILQQEGVWDADYVQQQREILEHHRAGMNRLAHNRLQSRETEDELDYGKMRETTARRLKGEQTVEGLPSDPPPAGLKS
jgi:hypothetical protein